MLTQPVAEVPIMILLKESTQALHDQTENAAFNQELVKGRLPLDTYVDSLAQLFLIHQALESELARHAASDERLQAVLREYQYQEPYLREDLAFFGRTPDTITPLAATAEFIAQIRRLATDQPVGLLGIHYVFEGSNNGGRFIARGVQRAYKLEGNSGTRYLNPYGERQADYWQTFKSDMNAASFTVEERRSIADAAGATFLAVMQLHRELHGGLSAKPGALRCPFHAGR